MGRKEEKQIANKIIHNLKVKGFTLHRYYAKTTKSIYIIPDYGVCGKIRISDHKGKKKYNYRYNIIKHYNGPKKTITDGKVRLFYDYNNVDELFRDVQCEKLYRINKYGLSNYRKYMIENSQDILFKSFKNVA